MTYNPMPVEPSGVIVSHEIDVVCYTESDAEVTAARISLDHLDFKRAQKLGHPVVHVCDADSAGWENVYSSVIEPSHDFDEIRKDFGFDDPIDGLLYLYQSVFHPSLRDWQRLIVGQICNMFPASTATVMSKSETDMNEKERASVGFRMIAGSDLLFRPNMIKNEYEAINDDRDPLDLFVPVDAQDYVEERWDVDLL
jgi:hypothetical protein